MVISQTLISEYVHVHLILTKLICNVLGKERLRTADADAEKALKCDRITFL